MIKRLIVVLTVLLISIKGFSQLPLKDIPLSVDEKRLFNLINAMRKDRKVKPLKFSESLYKNAKEYSQIMADKGIFKDKAFETTMGKDTGSEGVLRFKSIFSAGSNYIEELEASIRANFAYYRTVINGELTESAIAIVRSEATGLYYMSQLFRKGTGDSDAYYIEVADFARVLKATDTVTFGLNRKTVVEKLDEFINSPKAAYTPTITATTVSVAFSDVHLPSSYVQFVFSNSTEIFTGVHTKSYFYKYRDYKKELDRIKAIYNVPEKVKSPYYYQRFDEKLKLYYSITEDEIISFRWLADEGVYVTITKTPFGLRYVNRYKHRYNLKYSLSKDCYLRLLKEYLSQSPNFEVTDFIKNCKVTFFQPAKEMKVIMTLKNSKLEIRYFYNQKGNKVKSEFFRNKKKINTWYYKYDKDQKLVDIVVQ